MIPMTSTALPAMTAGGEIGGADGAAAAGLGFLDALLAALPPEAQALTEQELADWLQLQDVGLADLETLPVPADGSVPAAAQQAAALLGLIESSRLTLPAAESTEATLADEPTDVSVEVSVEVSAAGPLDGQPLQPALPLDGADLEVDTDVAAPVRAHAPPGTAPAPMLAGAGSAAAPAGLEAGPLPGFDMEPDAVPPEAGHEAPAAAVEQTFRPLLQAAAAGEPEAAPEPQLRVPVRHPEFGQAVGERLVWMVRNEVQEAKIRLDPPHLGPLEISVSVKDDRADVTIQAAHALTREALDAELPRLRGMLTDAGFASVDVGVARDRGGQAGEQRQGAGQHQAAAGADDAEHTEPVPVRTARGLIDHYA